MEMAALQDAEQAITQLKEEDEEVVAEGEGNEEQNDAALDADFQAAFM